MNHFTATQLVTPGVLVYDDERRKQYEKYQNMVDRAGFLNEKEKRNWALLGNLLTTDQLKKGAQIIISEEMRRQKIRMQLEKIKPTKEQHGG
ncbi:hypothetical protein JW758_04455 [Candidatus Peregrinibacteria bacterium]|nr:hypothetical protein [Candidatus Peregrinibacteria bacterium]